MLGSPPPHLRFARGSRSKTLENLGGGDSLPNKKEDVFLDDGCDE
jgi:hypothetical protein